MRKYLISIGIALLVISPWLYQTIKLFMENEGL